MLGLDSAFFHILQQCKAGTMLSYYNSLFLMLKLQLTLALACSGGRRNVKHHAGALLKMQIRAKGNHLVVVTYPILKGDSPSLGRSSWLTE